MVGGELALVGGELDLVGGELDMVGGELDLVGGELHLVGGELDMVGGELCGGELVMGRNRYKSFETLIVCPCLLIANTTLLAFKTLLFLFFSKIWASKLRVRLIYGCGLYMDVYGRQI